MKKTFLLLAMVITMMTQATAQEHMSFKGISFNNTLQEFTRQLTTKGMVLTKTEKLDMSVCSTFKGTFAGYNNCEVYVLSPNDKSFVFKVIVYTPDVNDWYLLKVMYEKTKESYENKYGTLKDDCDFHFFKSPYYEGDGFEMTAVKSGKCVYVSYWFLDYGTINMEISKFGSIKIVYADNTNWEKYKNKRQQATDNDI